MADIKIEGVMPYKEVILFKKFIHLASKDIAQVVKCSQRYVGIKYLSSRNKHATASITLGQLKSHWKELTYDECKLWDLLND